MKAAAAFIGPTVWDDEGPIPILKSSKMLITALCPPYPGRNYENQGEAGIWRYGACQALLSLGMISLAMIWIWLISYL